MVTHSTRGISLVDIYSQLLGSRESKTHKNLVCNPVRRTGHQSIEPALHLCMALNSIVLSH